MHDHEECMIVPEVCKTPDCTTGDVRVVVQKGFISSRRERGGGGGGGGRIERGDKS